jgi:hypothetical protein
MYKSAEISDSLVLGPLQLEHLESGSSHLFETYTAAAKMNLSRRESQQINK